LERNRAEETTRSILSLSAVDEDELLDVVRRYENKEIRIVFEK